MCRDIEVSELLPRRLVIQHVGYPKDEGLSELGSDVRRGCGRTKWTKNTLSKRRSTSRSFRADASQSDASSAA